LARRNECSAKKDDGLPRSDGGLSRKVKANANKTKIGLEEIEAAVDVYLPI
jgi:hypothetical protein